MLGTKQVTVYITDDGNEFQDKEEAKKHDAKCKLSAFFDTYYDRYDGDQVINIIVDNWDKIERIMLESE